MNTNPIINIETIAHAFTKIYQGLEKKYVSRMEEEMRKVVPSENSTLSLGTSYGEYDNMATFDIFISNPQNPEQASETQFDKIIHQWLLKAPISDLLNIMDTLQRLEKKEGNNYIIDGMPTFYDDELDEYYFHFIIQK